MSNDSSPVAALHEDHDTRPTIHFICPLTGGSSRTSTEAESKRKGKAPPIEPISGENMEF